MPAPHSSVGSCLSRFLAAGTTLAISGCGTEVGPAGYANTADITNGAAAYVGSNACAQCHAEIAALHARHGHAAALTPVQGEAPTFASNGVTTPLPPDSLAWTDVSYAVGGARTTANFLGTDGFLLTTGVTGVNTQWNLDFPPIRPAEFSAYQPVATTPLEFGFECFRCHTTGPMAQSATQPRFQDSRPGIPGGWDQAGVQCEACHGPGGKHFATIDGEVRIDRARIFVDPTGAQTCLQCHSSQFGEPGSDILAADGFIAANSQANELRASGGHAEFACGVCHSSHDSLTASRGAAIRNECLTCHSNMNMAKHAGRVYRRDGYEEPLTCESCHMPFAVKTGTSTLVDSVRSDGVLLDGQGRVGDTGSHIFRLNAADVDYRAVFTDDMAAVRRDADGHAALTLDFVCLRCHRGDGLFPLSVSRAAEIGALIHD